MISFHKAAEFRDRSIAERSGKTLAVEVSAAEALAPEIKDTARAIDSLWPLAFERLNQFWQRKLADLNSTSQRAQLMFDYAGSIRMPVEQQIALLEQNKDSGAVAHSAANQRIVPVEVQRFLVRECSAHAEALKALCKQPELDLETALTLSTHLNNEVRLALAAHMGGRMRLTEPAQAATKAAIFDNLVDLYTSDFAKHLVPVCKNESQIDAMYEQTGKTPDNLRCFAENPYTSAQTLLDISTTTTLNFLPGGRSVLDLASQQLAKRLPASDAELHI